MSWDFWVFGWVFFGWLRLLELGGFWVLLFELVFSGFGCCVVDLLSLLPGLALDWVL